MVGGMNMIKDNNSFKRNIEASVQDNEASVQDNETSVQNIEVFTQNSIRITTEVGKVYIDPFNLDEEPHDAGFILITHDHYDHFSPESIRKAACKDTILVVPEKMKSKADEVSGAVSRTVTVKPGEKREIDAVKTGEKRETVGMKSGEKRETVTVKPGEKREVECLRIETVPAYNILKPFHPKSAGWVGYILIIGGKRIYIAGDTDAVKEIKSVKCDVALVPVGGTFTMDAKKAAELVNSIKPQVAIPTHYGSIVGSPKDGEEFAKLVKSGIKVERKIRF